MDASLALRLANSRTLHADVAVDLWRLGDHETRMRLAARNDLPDVLADRIVDLARDAYAASATVTTSDPTSDPTSDLSAVQIVEWLNVGQLVEAFLDVPRRAAYLTALADLAPGRLLATQPDLPAELLEQIARHADPDTLDRLVRRSDLPDDLRRSTVARWTTTRDLTGQSHGTEMLRTIGDDPDTWLAVLSALTLAQTPLVGDALRVNGHDPRVVDAAADTLLRLIGTATKAAVDRMPTITEPGTTHTTNRIVTHQPAPPHRPAGVSTTSTRTIGPVTGRAGTPISWTQTVTMLTGAARQLLRSPRLTADHAHRLGDAAVLGPVAHTARRLGDADIAGTIASLTGAGRCGHRCTDPGHGPLLDALAVLGEEIDLPWTQLARPVVAHFADLGEHTAGTIFCRLDQRTVADLIADPDVRTNAAVVDQLGRSRHLPDGAYDDGDLIEQLAVAASPHLLRQPPADPHIPTVLRTYQPLTDLVGHPVYAAEITARLADLDTDARHTAYELLADWSGTLDDLIAAATHL